MTCQECEFRLGLGENVDDHLAECEDCRWLAEELRLNAVALGEMKARPQLPWVLAVAAGLLLAFGLLRVPREEVLPAPRIAIVAPRFDLPVTPKRVRHLRKPSPAEPLRVKMLTSDPDVVIYWIVDRKEGFE